MEKMLIPINYDTEQPTVSARDLHNGLEINTRFNDWFSRMTEYGFESGKDFYSKMSKTSETGGLGGNHERGGRAMAQPSDFRGHGKTDLHDPAV